MVVSSLAYTTSQQQFITQKRENRERCREKVVTRVGYEEARKIYSEALDRVQQENEVSK